MSHKSISIALICCILGISVAQAEDAPKRSKPDILFIAVDDLNDWTSYLGGHPQARTPNIDRLVAKGTAFTNSHCAAPACNPSRAALLGGKRPWQTGIYTNGDPAAGVLRETMTLNRHFMAQGYQAYGVGKIYHGKSSEGRDDSWTEWKGLMPSVHQESENLNGLKSSHFDWGAIDAQSSEMGDYKATDWAIDKLNHAPTDKPLFLALGYVKPHLPWYVPKEYYDRFPLDSIKLPVVKQDDLADVPPAGIRMANPAGDHAKVLKADQWKKAVQGYLATISFVDDQVGRLLDAIEKSPRGKELVIVWWTDHGWHLGEKEHWRKFALWEEATRTSLAIVAPGLTKPGTTCTAAVDYMSIYPTICEIAGLPVPEHVRGRSLTSLLKDPKSPWDGVAITTHGRGNHAVRDSKWRYIRYANGSEELYDHDKDPNEWTNLAGDPNMLAIKKKLAANLPAIDSEVPPVVKSGKAEPVEIFERAKTKRKSQARKKAQ